MFLLLVAFRHVGSKEPDADLTVNALDTEKRETGIEECVEFLNPHSEQTRKQEMTEFMEYYKNGKRKYKLDKADPEC